MQATIYSVKVEGPGVDPGTVRVSIQADIPGLWLEELQQATGAAVSTLRASAALWDGLRQAARILAQGGKR